MKDYGAATTFELLCRCKHRWSWQTCGDHKSDSKVVNALFAGATLFTGSQPAKIDEQVVSTISVQLL